MNPLGLIEVYLGDRHKTYKIKKKVSFPIDEKWYTLEESGAYLEGLKDGVELEKPKNVFMSKAEHKAYLVCQALIVMGALLLLGVTIYSLVTF